LSDIVTSGKTSVSEVVTELIDQFADEEEFLVAEVEDAGTIDQTTFSKDIMKQIEKVQKKQDKELNDVKSITQSVTKEFNKDSKASISTDKRTAKTDVTTAYKDAETELKALIDERGIRNVISKIKKIISEVNKSAGLITKGVTKIAKDDGKVIVVDLNTELRTKRSELNDDMDTVEATALSGIPEDTWYPEVSDANFRLSDLLAAGSTVEVVLTRSSDSLSASCAVTEVPVTTDWCHHTSLDDMYYDLLCSSVSEVKFGRTTMECTEAFRPSALWCGPLSDEDEELCSAAIETLEDMLWDSVNASYTGTEDEWDRY